MTPLEFLDGVKRIEEGIPGLKLQHSSIPLYQDQLRSWSGSDWMRAADSFVESDDPLRRFPSLGQCKKALYACSRKRHRASGNGCGVCRFSGLVIVPHPKMPPDSHYTAAIRCRCDLGMLELASYQRPDGTIIYFDQITPALYEIALHEYQNTPLPPDPDWITEIDVDGVPMVRLPSLTELLDQSRLEYAKKSTTSPKV
tara:strand:+ start:1105 stop:1701 length:597 start_codon:yes stop_codon:yes gene_type:complete